MDNQTKNFLIYKLEKATPLLLDYILNQGVTEKSKLVSSLVPELTLWEKTNEGKQPKPEVQDFLKNLENTINQFIKSYEPNKSHRSSK